MDEIRDLDDPMRRLVSCRSCLNEIPLSEAVVPEASDYLPYFCSLDCYASWRARAAEIYPSLR
jgi:Domain of unknown function (DUF3330).